MKTTAKLRPAVKRHGGKAYLARRIIARFPGHECSQLMQNPIFPEETRQSGPVVPRPARICP